MLARNALRLCLLLLPLAEGTLLAADAPRPLNITVFGDGVTRAVLADTTLGQYASVELWDAFNQLKFNADTAQYLPDGQALLAYPLMQADAFTARDGLAAVQGGQSYSLKTRLTQATGRPVQVTQIAVLGGSYRQGDSQLALDKTALAAPGAQPADLVVVDLGRTDFALFPAPEDFAQQVRWFFAKLTALHPRSRLLVTRLLDLVGQIDRADRVAYYGPIAGWQTCAKATAESRFGGAWPAPRRR